MVKIIKWKENILVYLDNIIERFNWLNLILKKTVHVSIIELIDLNIRFMTTFFNLT